MAPASSYRARAAVLALLSSGVVGACGQAVREPSERPAGGGGDAGDACAECGGQLELAQGGEGGESAPTPGGSASGAGEAGALAEAGQGALAQAGAGGSEPSPEPDLSIRRVTVSQSLELPLMVDGAAVPLAERALPLVAAKRALFRVFVQPGPGFVARDLVGVLELVSPAGNETFVSERAISLASSQEDLATTFDFRVAAQDLTTQTEYRVRVLEADASPLAGFPASGYLPLEARQREAFRLVIVPLVANGYAPRTGPAELSGLSERVLALYPSTGVEVSVAPPLTLPYEVDGDGAGWDDALDDLYDARRKAAPPRDVFYYGMLAPSSSYDDYCSSGCTLGYANVADPDDETSRGGIGISVFQDGSGVEDAWDTLVHELGHALGREHSPCGVPKEGRDPEFPYATGNLGQTYGFDFAGNALVNPKQYRDFMGYCTRVWVSDYTYRGLFERLEHIAGEGFQALSWSPPERFRVARVGRDGVVTWRSDLSHSGRGGQWRSFQLLGASGEPVGSIQGRIVRRDHSRGALVWLPAAELTASGAAGVDLSPLGGGPLPL